MAAQDKTVKVTIVVDEAAAAKAKRAILEIKQQVDSLVKSTQTLGQFLGGSSFTKVGNQASQPGQSSMTQATHSAAGRAGGGAVAALTNLAGNVAGNLRGVDSSTKTAFKSIEDGFKRLVDSQDREARRLEGIWGRVKRLVSGGGWATTGGGSAAGANAGGGGAPGVSNPPAAVPAGGGNRGSGPPGFLAGVAQQFGVPTGVLGGAAAVGAGVKIAGAAIGASYGNEHASALLDLERPFFGVEARARIGSTMGSNALAIRHGDAARAFSLMTLSSDANFQSLSGDKMMMRREQRLRMEHAVSAGEMMGKDGPISGLWHKFKDKIGQQVGGELGGTTIEGSAPGFFSRLGNRVKNHVKYGGVMGAAVSHQEIAAQNRAASTPENQTEAEAQREMARGHALAQAAEDRQRMVDADIASRPGFNDRINSVYNRSTSDSALMRALGMSGRDIVRKNADGVQEKFNAATEIRARAVGLGYTEGDFAGAAGQLSSYGRGFLGKYGSILSPTAGGLSNAAEIQGIGAQFGKFGALLGKGGKSGIQSMIGRGGLDITAGVQVSGLGLGAMRGSFIGGGMSGTGGSGLMETLMTAAYSGGGTGADMYQSGMVQAGMGRRGAEQSGGVDQLNKALNINAAMKSSPQAPWATRNMLLSLDEAQLLDIVKSGGKNMPQALIDNGVTYEMVRDYWQARNATSFARFGRSNVYGTADQRSAVDSYTKAGGLGFLRGKSPKEISKILNQLAGARSAAGGSFKEHRGALEVELAGMGLKATPRGHGAGHGIARDSSMGAANASKQRIEHKTARTESEEGETHRRVFDKMSDIQDTEQGAADASTKAMAGGSNMGQAVMDVNKALNNFVSNLQNMIKDAQGRGKAGPTAKAR